MKIQTKPIDSLTPHPKNIRAHGEAQIKEFVRSIEMFGTLRPIVVDEDNVILAGHGLWEAYKAKGETKAPVMVVPGLDEKGKLKLMMADNKIFQLGSDNFGMIDAILSEIQDFDIPGYNPVDLEAIYGGITPEEALEEFKQAGEDVDKMLKRNLEPVPAKAKIEHEVPAQRPQDDQRGAEQAEGIEDYVICPHCGGKVILC